MMLYTVCLFHFREHQVSFFNPHVTCWSEALIPYESRAKEKCCILLYVITGHSTSVGSLVEVCPLMFDLADVTASSLEWPCGVR